MEDFGVIIKHTLTVFQTKLINTMKTKPVNMNQNKLRIEAFGSKSLSDPDFG